MANTAPIALLVLTCAGLGASVLGWLGLGFARLESRLGFLRDGLPEGARAPRWTMSDSEGGVVTAAGGWQALVFGDHSLVEFPDLQAGLAELAERFEIDLLIAARYPAEVVGAALQSELRPRARLLNVSQAFYDRHNVRAMPLIMLIDPRGRIAGNGMFDNGASVLHLAAVAGVPARSTSGVQEPIVAVIG